MHRLIRTGFPLLLALAAGVHAPARAEVFISELCDPRLDYTTDRFIEIFNPGPATVDLTGWSLVAVGNGTDIFTWNLSGPIAAGEALVAGDGDPVDPFPVDFADDAWSSSNGLWNGKVGDGAKLLDDSAAVVDHVVVDATRFENQDYVRVPGVTAPNTAFDPSEWSATAVDLPSQGSPGVHSAEPPVPTPEISNVALDPPAPLPGQPVHVQAVVTDDEAVIRTVTLQWGYAPASLTGEIPMANLFGDVYRTDAPIPGQAGGVTIHYRVEAVNDVPSAGTSPVLAFSVPVEVAIRDIQGEAASSPYDGFPVITAGVVTGVYGDHVTLQDGPGAWNGVWMESPPGVAEGESVRVYGTVTESLGGGFAGTTCLAAPVVLQSFGTLPLPAPTLVSTLDAGGEEYEGVLLVTARVACTGTDLSSAWLGDDGTGPVVVGELGGDLSPVLGTVYNVAGILREVAAAYRIEPRGPGDLQWVEDPAAPSLVRVTAPEATRVTVAFSEPLEPSSAETAGHYLVPGLVVQAAALQAGYPTLVDLTVSPMQETTYTLTVSGVADTFGNVAAGLARDFTYVDLGIPAGYYDGTEGLSGEDLRAALHDIIDGHEVHSYDFAWTAYYTTDDKPNGKVWDIYSDVPGGVPPYEYDFGVDEGGIGGAEGLGYTREHSWPKSWFGGSVSPMYTDLFALYPCDAHVNGNRGVYPYGEVDSPGWVSLNGSRVGPCSYPGYTGTAFEPIDAYKGDLARTYFYMATRYYGEDAGWPGGPMTDGADLLPWALAMLREWHESDPVSPKEIERNGAVYGFQANRNPFIDHPEFVDRIWDELSAAAPAPGRPVTLHQNVPNPFNPATRIRFDLPGPETISLRIYDLAGRLVRTLLDAEACPAGPGEVVWRGRDEAGRQVASGTYFYRLEAGPHGETKRMVLVR